MSYSKSFGESALRRTRIGIAATYALLAACATIANLAAQAALLAAYRGPRHVFLSVMLGTAVGLGLKYVLDKRYIFRFRARDAAHDGRTFLLYAATGIATTAIFWGMEFAFHVGFDGSDGMRYLGGAIGLAIGYVTKYQLDKRHVFGTGGA